MFKMLQMERSPCLYTHYKVVDIFSFLIGGFAETFDIAVVFICLVCNKA